MYDFVDMIMLALSFIFFFQAMAPTYDIKYFVPSDKARFKLYNIFPISLIGYSIFTFKRFWNLGSG